MDEIEVRKVTDRLRRLCSRREYCSSDILKKAVTALEGDKEIAEKVLAELIKDKYVDDFRYASAYAREKAMISGWGETKIRYMLSGKRVASDIIAQALNEIDEGKASTRLEKIIENKYRSLKSDPQCRLKLIRFGLGRGYSYDEVSAAVSRII